MQNPVPSTNTGRSTRRPVVGSIAPQRIAIDEYELAARWGLSVRTIRRWRQPRVIKYWSRNSIMVYDLPTTHPLTVRFSRYALRATSRLQAALSFLEMLLRTIVHIDGYNLYYGLLRKSAKNGSTSFRHSRSISLMHQLT